MVKTMFLKISINRVIYVLPTLKILIIYSATPCFRIFKQLVPIYFFDFYSWVGKCIVACGIVYYKVFCTNNSHYLLIHQVADVVCYFLRFLPIRCRHDFLRSLPNGPSHCFLRFLPIGPNLCFLRFLSIGPNLCFLRYFPIGHTQSRLASFLKLQKLLFIRGISSLNNCT